MGMIKYISCFKAMEIRAVDGARFVSDSDTLCEMISNNNYRGKIVSR